MAEVNAKSIVINVGTDSYKTTSVSFEDICTEIGVTKQVFSELLFRDFYTPLFEHAPTSSDVSYTDPSDGKSKPFKVGQCCVYPESESSDGWGFSVAKHVETSANGSSASIVWQKIINESSMGKQAIYSLFGLSV